MILSAAQSHFQDFREGRGDLLKNEGVAAGSEGLEIAVEIGSGNAGFKMMAGIFKNRI